MTLKIKTPVGLVIHADRLCDCKERGGTHPVALRSIKYPNTAHNPKIARLIEQETTSLWELHYMGGGVILYNHKDCTYLERTPNDNSL